MATEKEIAALWDERIKQDKELIAAYGEAIDWLFAYTETLPEDALIREVLRWQVSFMITRQENTAKSLKKNLVLQARSNENGNRNL